MSNNNRSLSTRFTLLLLLLASPSLAAAPVDYSAVLAPFVNDDTFAIAHLKLAAMNSIGDASELLQMLPKTAVPSASDLVAFRHLTGAIKSLHSVGAEEAFVVLGLADLHEKGGPLVVLTVNGDQSRSSVTALLEGFTKQISGSSSAMPKFSVRHNNAGAIFFGTDQTVARYQSRQATKRADLTEALFRQFKDGAIASAVFCPGPDFRRVVRELWPELPGSLATLRGELADRWLSLEAAVNMPPDAKPRLALEARDAKAAELFAKLWRNLPAETTEFGDNDKAKAEVKGYAQLLVDALPATVEGTRVVIKLPSDGSHLTKLHAIFGQAADAAIESSRRRARVDQFKNVALGLLNFESANKHLPPPAIRDKEGRPLLSWRVAILPYVEQQNLYNQFHLDEPWDSPHNLKLLRILPSVYADPGHDDLSREGKTTVVAPVGKGTVFDTKDGVAYREITDGTVKTILIVEVPPEKAVPWTKPEDWEVDTAHPRRGIERTDRDQFVTAWCDASVQLIPTNTDEAKLRAYLIRNDGEVVDRP